MRRVVFGKLAQRDVDAIWRYVARDSIGAAEKVVDQVERAVRQLAEQPGLGHRRPELESSRYRVWSVYAYLIIYRFGPKTVTVVRVVHGARDLRRIFREG
jgi:antitoxin ParD1/3/4/toxin ParE1/3/4